MKVVLFPNILYLDNVEFHEDATVKSGYVINGAWFYESTEDEGFSFRLGYSEGKASKVGQGNYVSKHKRNKQEESFVIVPFNYTEEITDFRDYSQVIEWAQSQKPSTKEELESALVLDIEYKAQKKQEYDLFDDDIAF